MSNGKLDISRLDMIIKKTIEAIDASKNQIYEIAEGARKECSRLAQELKELKEQTKQIIKTVEILERELKESRKKLMLLSKTFHDRSDSRLKEAYEKADSLRVDLAVKREQEQNLIVRRNELEMRLKDAYKTVERAENLISQVGAVMDYLSGDLLDLSFQLENIQQKEKLGIKIIKAQEEERQRVARDIHDGPAQSMSNVVLKAEICEKLIEIDVYKAKSELRELKNVVRSCLQDIRRIIYDLRPMSLDDLGLIPTIQRYVSNYQDETGIETCFRASGNYSDISPVISLTTFRIAQEALNNVKKHAQAKNVVINLSLSESTLSLYVSDDGKGFNLDEVNKRSYDNSGGFGLYSMKERVELLSGTFELQSNIGQGTRLMIEIPLKSNAEVEYGKDTSVNS